MGEQGLADSRVSMAGYTGHSCYFRVGPVVHRRFHNHHQRLESIIVWQVRCGYFLLPCPRRHPISASQQPHRLLLLLSPPRSFGVTSKVWRALAKQGGVRCHSSAPWRPQVGTRNAGTRSVSLPYPETPVKGCFCHPALGG